MTILRSILLMVFLGWCMAACSTTPDPTPTLRAAPTAFPTGFPPDRTPMQIQPALRTPTPIPTQNAIMAASVTPRPTTNATPYPIELVQQGGLYYSIFCVACHGADARGLAGLGVTLIESTFFGERSDLEVLAYVIAGRRADDPASLSGIEMPSRAGFPNLTDEQILAIIAYLRGLPRP